MFLNLKKSAWFSSGASFAAGMLILSLALHAIMALSLRGKFWFDTIAYFQLASVIFDPDGLRQLYEGQFGIVYQHLMPGLPAMISVMDALFGQRMWLATALLQYGSSALASVYLADSLGTRVSRPAKVLIVVLIAIFPYYSAFHSAILTESVSASIFLVMLATMLRGLDGRLKLPLALVVVLALGVLGGQFRSYITGMGGVCGVLLIFHAHGLRRIALYAIPVAAVVLGMLAFPLYRLAAGSEFALPNVQSLMLRHVSYVAGQLDDKSQRALDGVVLDPDIRQRMISAPSSLSLDDAIKMIADLEALGMTQSAARDLIAAAAQTIRLQSFDTIARQMQLSLASLGFQDLSTCCNPDRVLGRDGMTGKSQLEHLRFYYRWNAGLDNGDYLSWFDSFTRAYRDAPGLYTPEVVDWYVARVAPYVSQYANPARDVLLPLVLIPADVLVWAGLAGLLLLVIADWRLGVALSAAFGLVYVAALTASVVGDNRHAHLLWPLYIIGIVALAERLIATVGRRWGGQR